MITSKQRSKLRALANGVEPIFQLGKGGITDNFIKQLDDALEARELIKFTVLKNADVTAKEIVNSLAEQLNAEPVGAIGNKVTLYRYSTKKDKHIEI